MTQITCLHPAYLLAIEPDNTVLLKHSLVMEDEKSSLFCQNLRQDRIIQRSPTAHREAETAKAHRG